LPPCMGQTPPPTTIRRQRKPLRFDIAVHCDDNGLATDNTTPEPSESR
jgi:hypothetical protein